MRKYLGLFSLFIWNSKLRITRSIEYKADFIVGLVISLTLSSMGPITQYLLFTQTKGYPGWDIRQVILLQGVLLTWIGLKSMAFGDLRSIINEIVRKGDLDRILLKPFPAIGVLLTSCFSLNSIGTLVAGLIITGVSINRLNLHIGLVETGLILVSMIFAIVFYMALLIFLCGIVVMLVQMGRVWEVVDTLLRFGEYPVNIFSKLVQVIFVFFFPIAVFVYLPTQVLLNRLDLTFLIGFISCTAIFLLSIKFWNSCMKKYTSAGG